MWLQTADSHQRASSHPRLSFHRRKLYFWKLVKMRVSFWDLVLCQVPPTFILLLLSCVCYWASLESKQRNTTQSLWWDLHVSLVVQQSCVPSGLGTGAVTGNCYHPCYAAILFPGRWREWYPSAAACGTADAKGRATGRTNNSHRFFFCSLQYQQFVYPFWFCFHAIASSTLDCVSRQKQREPWVSDAPTGEITPCHLAHNIHSLIKEPSLPLRSLHLADRQTGKNWLA